MRVRAEAAQQPKLAVLLRQLLGTQARTRLSAISDGFVPTQIQPSIRVRHVNRQACLRATMTPDLFRFRRGCGHLAPEAGVAPLSLAVHRAVGGVCLAPALQPLATRLLVLLPTQPHSGHSL
eukprot:COSAG04_NODE_216_length_19953_cov_85.343558_9_plen_122_part_00